MDLMPDDEFYNEDNPLDHEPESVNFSWDTNQNLGENLTIQSPEMKDIPCEDLSQDFHLQHTTRNDEPLLLDYEPGSERKPPRPRSIFPDPVFRPTPFPQENKGKTFPFNPDFKKTPDHSPFLDGISGSISTNYAPLPHKKLFHSGGGGGGNRSRRDVHAELRRKAYYDQPIDIRDNAEKRKEVLHTRRHALCEYTEAECRFLDAHDRLPFNLVNRNIVGIPPIGIDIKSIHYNTIYPPTTGQCVRCLEQSTPAYVCDPCGHELREWVDEDELRQMERDEQGHPDPKELMEERERQHPDGHQFDPSMGGDE